MKNLISVALALIMAFSLAACGGSAQTSGSQNTQGKQDTELTKVIYIGGTLGDAGIADSTSVVFLVVAILTKCLQVIP